MRSIVLDSYYTGKWVVLTILRRCPKSSALIHWVGEDSWCAPVAEAVGHDDGSGVLFHSGDDQGWTGHFVYGDNSA
jgi:hypothetical protein